MGSARILPLASCHFTNANNTESIIQILNKNNRLQAQLTINGSVSFDKVELVDFSIAQGISANDLMTDLSYNRNLGEQMIAQAMLAEESNKGASGIQDLSSVRNARVYLLNRGVAILEASNEHGAPLGSLVIDLSLIHI